MRTNWWLEVLPARTPVYWLAEALLDMQKRCDLDCHNTETLCQSSSLFFSREAHSHHLHGLHSSMASFLPQWQAKMPMSRPVYIHDAFCNSLAISSLGVSSNIEDLLSWQITFQGEWRLHPQVVQLIWSQFGKAEVDLFASQESSHFLLWYFLTKDTLGTEALAMAPWICEKICLWRSW